MRISYRAIQRGEQPKQILTEAEIKRLDDIGFEWEPSPNLKTFEDRCTELLEFKEENGHCRVPKTKSKDVKYYSLGNWVGNMRSPYRAIQRGEKPKRNISEAEIKRLGDIGFEWVPS
jgi:hypothetical protein